MKQNYRRYIMPVMLLVLLLVACFVAPAVMQGSAPYVGLSPASELAGETSQAIGVGDNGQLQTPGRDFSITSTQSFDTDNWRLSAIHSLIGAGDGYIVFRKQSGVYHVVLGPGSTFNAAYTKTMPSDLVAYLTQKGIVYDSSN